ncbi:MAG: hypothetical protein PVG39_00550 [Desulfobacteraceae bacterium]
MIYKTTIEIGRTFKTNGELINTIKTLRGFKDIKIKLSVRLFDPKKKKVFKTRITGSRLMDESPENLYLQVKFYLDSSTRRGMCVRGVLYLPDIVHMLLDEKASQEAFSEKVDNTPPALGPSSLPHNMLENNSMDALVANGKLVYRRRKKSPLRKALYELLPEKKTVGNLTKKKKRKLVRENHNSLDQVTEKILAEIMKLHWFVSHRKSSQSYKKSFEFVQKHYRRYRSSLVDIFRLGNSYFSNPRFIYNPMKKITVYEFFKYHTETINRSKALQRIGVKSWFKEFAKGQDHIEEYFVKRQKDSHPELTKEMEKIWLDFKKSPDIKSHEHDNLVRFVEKCFIFRDANQSRIKSARDLISILKDIILSDQNTHVKNTNYLLTDYFWRNTIPDALKKWGMFEHHERINLI